MEKTKEELEELKEEVEKVTSKLKELSEEEMKEVIGGCWYPGLDRFHNK